MANQPRGLVVTIVNNFLNSFKFRKSVANAATQLVGEDPFGNKYFEIPADPSRGKRRPIRWYTAINTPDKSTFEKTFTDGFDSELPSEWESWLRHRRDNPPEPEDVIRSLQMSELKKMNAAKLEEKRTEELKAEGIYSGDNEVKPQDHEKPFYPKRQEYELVPGETTENVKNRWKDFENPYSKNK